MREIESREQWDIVVAEGATAGIAVQAVDLTDATKVIRGLDLTGSLFLGCGLTITAQRHIERQGGTVLPPLANLPFAAYPNALYTPEQLFAGFDPARPNSYEKTLDGRVYAWWQATGRTRPEHIGISLARRLHDHGITDALEEYIAGRKVVAIMGGHNLTRDSAAYRMVTEIGRALTRAGYLVASGGGPGAMEATHVGAWCAPLPDDALETALDLLGRRPTDAAAGRGVHEYEDRDWLVRAMRVRDQLPRPSADEGRSLGIPTWHYGHEPPNAFATDIAKYFANSVREEGLLSIARYGVIYAPGSAGTIQEVFQDAAQNHYASLGVISPMVFLGTSYWTETKPVYPLLQRLAADRHYGRLLATADDADEVLEIVTQEQLLAPDGSPAV